MSLLRPKLPRLALAAMTLILMGALVAAPSVSGARNAVKQFTATIAPTTATGGVADTWTEHIKNCGTPVEAPCTASSTIAIGQVRITVPPEFRSEPDFSVGVTASSGNNWTLVSYTSATGVIVAEAVTGNDKLASGESVDIAIDAIPECIAGSKPFPTTAVGGLPNGPNNQPFDLVPLGSPPPSVTITGCQLASGGTATDPVTGQTETIEGDFTGHVNVTFGGDLDCGFDEEFGSQWSQFHLPTQVNDIPADDFVAGPNPKRLISTFPAEGDDSSLYLICYAVPKADHPIAFKTRGGGDATTRTVDGAESWVGILPNCYDPISGDTRPEPCVSEQFLDLITNRIVISVRVPPLDPHRK
jgi:hypothetical protein